MDENTNKNYILDASVVLSILLPDEKTKPKAKKLLKIILNPQHNLFSCSLLPYEVNNGLKSAVLRKRFSKTVANKILNHFQRLPIKLRPINHQKTLSLAIKHNKLSYYDASYLHLSKSNRYPLLTLDSKLKRLAN